MEPLKINWNNWNWNGLPVCLSPKRQYISKLRFRRSLDDLEQKSFQSLKK